MYTIKLNGIFSLIILFLLAACSKPKIQQNVVTNKDRKMHVAITTTKGLIVVKLYDETPLHKDNFLKLVKSNFYDSLLFHRVIRDFMVQTGDPDSKNATQNKMLGNGGLNYTVPAEFKPNLFHKKGALAAARNNNPAKASSSCQFYFVQGVVFNESTIEVAKARNRWPATITEAQKQVYKTIGGTPHLDQNYTVFGEVVQGLEIIDNIAKTPTGNADRPQEDIRILSMKLIKPVKTK
jgi:cyclophilin family peptidyl-prolyl cis-trans isomerase